MFSTQPATPTTQQQHPTTPRCDSTDSLHSTDSLPRKWQHDTGSAVTKICCLYNTLLPLQHSTNTRLAVQTMYVSPLPAMLHVDLLSHTPASRAQQALPGVNASGRVGATCDAAQEQLQDMRHSGACNISTGRPHALSSTVLPCCASNVLNRLAGLQRCLQHCLGNVLHCQNM